MNRNHSATYGRHGSADLTRSTTTPCPGRQVRRHGGLREPAGPYVVGLLQLGDLGGQRGRNGISAPHSGQLRVIGWDIRPDCRGAPRGSRSRQSATHSAGTFAEPAAQTVEAGHHRRMELEDEQQRADEAQQALDDELLLLAALAGEPTWAELNPYGWLALDLGDGLR